MPALSPHGVFLSYRREDSGAYAILLKEHLSERFPDVSVFMDLDAIKRPALILRKRSSLAWTRARS